MRARILTALIALVVIVGCAKPFHLKPSDREHPSPWPSYRHDPGATGVMSSSGFTGKLDTLWNARTGEKPSGPLTLSQGLIMVPSAKKRVRVYEALTGHGRGRLRMTSPPQTSLDLVDSLGLVAVGPGRNTLYCLQLVRSKVKWKASVKDASPGSILVSNRLIIGSTEGSLSAFNLSSGLREWSFKAEDRFVAPVSYDNGKLYQPSDRGVLHVLSEMSGKELYQVNLKGPVVSAAAISDGAFVGDVLGNVYSIAPDNGALRWQHTVDGPLWTTPAVTSDLVIVGHSGGDIVALDRTSGREVWKYAVTEVIKASPIVVGEIVVVATMRGSILTLDLHTGTLIARTQLNSAVAFAPISDGSFLYVITQSGRLLCLGERNEQSNQSHH